MNAQVKFVEFENVVPFSRFQAQKASVSVIGLGYVGAVSTACLARLGHRVIGADLDPQKTIQIDEGRPPIFEEGLGCLLSSGVERGLISATTDVLEAVEKTDITFVSVGTPTKEDGGCDYRYGISAAHMIGEALARKDAYHIIVMRCSVPPSTTLQVMVPEIEMASGKKLGKDFDVCFNPEFLREGTAIFDFDNPPKTVIGASSQYAAEEVSKIYAPVDGNIIHTSIEVAEMVKYVDNVWHAAKVCFANEVGRVCKPLSIDSHQVMDIFVQDTKLNLSPYYLKPGFAYGGSCLPKEVRAVSHLAEQLNVATPLINSLAETNNQQIEAVTNLVRAKAHRKVGFYGIAFKSGTDDLRESPTLEVMHQLWSEGFEIKAFDPAINLGADLVAQFGYLKTFAPHTLDMVSQFPSIICEGSCEISDACDLVVVSQNTPEIRAAVEAAMGDVEIIDLVRLFKSQPASENYYGLSW